MNQTIHDHVYGKSITDPCLDGLNPEKLIYDIAESYNIFLNITKKKYITY